MSAFTNDAGYLTADSLTDLNNQLDQMQQALDSAQQSIDNLQQQMADAVTALCPATVQDYDGNTYNTVKIGNQCWLKENLRSTHYADGTAVSEYSHANNDNANDAIYGLYYNWNVAMNGAAGTADGEVQGICPTGWHIPTEAEFVQLGTYVSSQSGYICGSNTSSNNLVFNGIAKALVSTTGWNSSTEACAPGNQPELNNAADFSAQAAGYQASSGTFKNFGTDAWFWTATSTVNNEDRKVLVDITSVFDGLIILNDPGSLPGNRNSIRCVRNNSLGEALNELNESIDNMQQDVQQDIANATFVCGTTTVSDYDGNVYNTVKIGNQCWTKENLKTTHYTNGTEIPVGTNPYEDTIPYRFAPNGDEANVAIYGYLYNWYATMNGAAASDANPSGVQGICPVGWHVPSSLEWSQMNDYVNSRDEFTCDNILDEPQKIIPALTDPFWGMTLDAGCDMLKNATGFSALPAGRSQYESTSYLYFGFQAQFWTSSSQSIYNGKWARIYTWIAFDNSTNKRNGMSVRCVRDEMSEIDQGLNNLQEQMDSQVDNLQQTIDSLENSMFVCGVSTLKDVDGNEYNTVKIGNQCWMKENLRTLHYADGEGLLYVEDADVDQAWYAYPNADASNVPTLGYLYDKIAALRDAPSSIANPSGVQGICPTGWHIPSNAEWTQLTDYVKSQSDFVCGGNVNNIAKALSGTSLWYTGANACYPGYDRSTNNATGFSALPAGFYDIQTYSASSYQLQARFWLTKNNFDQYLTATINKDNSTAMIYSLNVNSVDDGYSVRCLRDNQSYMDGVIDNMQQNMMDQIQNMINNSIVPLQNQINQLQNEINQQQHIIDSLQTAASLSTCGSITVSDYDGNVYNTVRIGNQCWMRENLRTTHYANGTEIALGTSTSTITPYRYNPNDDASNVITYGYLYNWPALMKGAASSEANPSGVQGICPNGWHVPSDAEWTQLTDFLGSQSQYQCNSSSTNIAKALASTMGWNSNSDDCTVGNTPSNNNTSGFSALPAGMYFGTPYNYANCAYLWSATEENESYSYVHKLVYNRTSLSTDGTIKYCGCSVRCVRD